jgi:hypothetical protein
MFVGVDAMKPGLEDGRGERGGQERESRLSTPTLATAGSRS